MRRFALVISAALGLLVAGGVWAEIDRPRADEKDKQPKPELGEAGGDEGGLSPDEHDAIHKKLAEESEANLKEIARLMEKIRDSLSRKQTGEPTQSDQRDAVKKLQELIDKVGKG